MAREPDDSAARTFHAAALIGLEQYTAARMELTATVEAQRDENPQGRAMLYNALAVALLLENALTPEKQSQLERAECLSREAQELYPCVLEYRSTRALTLIATGSPEMALTLLEYCHYDSGTERQRGHREVARGFALYRLGQLTAANHSIQTAIKLEPRSVQMFRALGIPYTEASL